MTPEELIELMDEHSLTINQMAALCRVDRGTVVRWRSGKSEINYLSALGIRLVLFALSMRTKLAA